MHEKRLTSQLLKYWNIVRRNRTIPDVRHINPSAIEKLWAQCFLLSCDNLRENFSYQYECVGPLVTDFYERDMTDQYVDDTVEENVHLSLRRLLHQVITQHSPVDDEGNFLKENGKLMKYRFILMPFGDDDGITHVMGGLSFMLFDAA